MATRTKTVGKNCSKPITKFSADEALQYFLKAKSYFNLDLPPYLNMEPLIKGAHKFLDKRPFTEFKKSDPSDLADVNYQFISNKDGRFSWRPFELIHPAIYATIVDTLCEPANWKQLQKRFREFSTTVVQCCSIPVESDNRQSDTAAQITNWWQEVEQESLRLALEFTHVLQSDVVNCYGSLYTHSIVWAIHGKDAAKRKKQSKKLFGNNLDYYIRAGRFGQTNGIPQGSTMMDFFAELVLGYVDTLIDSKLKTLKLASKTKIRILRYRDDYRIFSNSSQDAEEALKVIADALREVGMQLGVAKTISFENPVLGSVKPDKLAAINMQDLGGKNAKTIQKQLLRIHSFGIQHRNSGALKRLVSDFYNDLQTSKIYNEDLEVLVSIATDISYVSPGTFPCIAAILSYLFQNITSKQKKKRLWDKVIKKMKKIPYNGYLDIWLQRVINPIHKSLNFKSDENICQLVIGGSVNLWNNDWINSKQLLKRLDVKNILISNPRDVSETVAPSEVLLFQENAENY